jgi:hypothetical protein
MTMIYDTLKLLNLLCSFSSSRTQQASQFGLLGTLKELMLHIFKLNDQFSQNKRIKLFRQILILFEDNISHGTDFGKVELLNNEVHLLLLQVMSGSMPLITQYSSLCSVSSSNQKEKLKQSHILSKITKDHETNSQIANIFTLWV